MTPKERLETVIRGGMMKLLDLIPQNGCDFSETLSPTGCTGSISTRRWTGLP
jgi:hypothetical protein